ncbi:SMP-30/gluconolactonase/LRE family protein [Terrarubrum flagellatum]|uniref:SMP-30/gluconolactonase/LRE family protein n=1 Tax=Terrirubrum flagellatum TaxID=2895980 RepID=UPI00314558D6
MRTDFPEITVHIDRQLGLGEGPCWSPEEQALYFIDIQAPALMRLDPATAAIRSWRMPATIGSFGFCPDGRAIVALRNGVHFFDFKTETLEFLVHPEPDKPTNRLNDGKIGPDGRFWVGSMDDRPDRQPVAALYRIDADGSSHQMFDGLYVSNGLAFSPDGRTLWHSDSRGPWVHTFDLDRKTGALSNQRKVITLTDAEGRPDGGACDTEGYYWSAGVSAGCINRIAPGGTIERKIKVPLAAPTMPCFGGPDLKTLYVTSLTSDRLGPKEAGSLISFRVDVPGAPIAKFGEPLKL